MQPGNEQYGARPPQDDFRGQHDFRGQGDQQQHSDARPGRDGSPVGPKRARTGLILLAAFLAELIVIAGVGNQYVTNKIQRSSFNHSRSSGLAHVPEVYNWRFTPVPRDPYHLWLGSFGLIGTTILISLLLIFAVARGPVTFGRAFFGAWMAVIVATMLGGYVRALIVNLPTQPGQGRLSRAFFSATAPGSLTFLAGLGLGLIVAVVVSIIAVTTRRSPRQTLDPALAPAGAGYPDQGERRGPEQRYQPGGPEQGYHQGPGGPGGAPWQDRYSGAPQRDSAGRGGDADSTQTTTLPSMRKGSGATSTDQLSGTDADRAAAETVRQPAAEPESEVRAPAQTQGGQATTQFPRPPDDEDIDPEH